VVIGVEQQPQRVRQLLASGLVRQVGLVTIGVTDNWQVILFFLDFKMDISNSKRQWHRAKDTDA
jgi:hypothetical protein